MPATENNATFERIQREIKDVMEREKELRNGYKQGSQNNNNNELKNNFNGNITTNGHDRPPGPPLVRTTSVVNEGETKKPANFRRFISNPSGTKGVMQRFIKSRGKLNAVSALTNTRAIHEWTLPDFTSAKVPVTAGKGARNGFVSVEVRLRKEIQDAHKREHELKVLRRQSQPNLDTLTNLDEPLEPSLLGGMRSSKSMAQLYDSCENLDETASAPSSLKAARSLAELCDASEEEIQRPQSLIMQFENMIIKNKQTTTF